MKTTKRKLKISVCTMAAVSTLMLAAPAAYADDWHRVDTSNTWAGCQTYLLINFGNWPADRVKCEIDGSWTPWQTYGGYVYY
ncbi:hypothetical protein ABH920_010076 [Catenulispora sp. EB89]|uniref:hypothetical protein n=1 Tax=Catenulispora sp. EB89 TaxID=3156257 RepID=UPI0035197D17